MSVPTDVSTSGMANANPCTGVNSDALPETKASSTITKLSSKTGVSTKNTLSPTTSLTPHPSPLTVPQPRSSFNVQHSTLNVKDSPLTVPESRSSFNVQHSTLNVKDSPLTVKNWYALRTTYSREKQAYDYITTHGGTAYLPTLKVHKEVDGKHVAQLESRIPNILFAHGTLKEVQHFVYDNKNLPYLRFYYSQERFDGKLVRRPLIVPERQMESLRIICAVDDGNIALVPQNDTHFAKGQLVRIIQGRFAGVTGRVARYQGQQRVAVIIDGLIAIATAYIPTAFLEPIDDNGER